MSTVDHRTFSDKISDDIAEFGGSWKFIFSCAALLFVWAVWNIFAPWVFDPYPFIFMNLFLSGLAIFQAPIILMAQNRAETKQDEAYRHFFGEIKRLVQKDIMLEKKILRILGERGSGIAAVAAEAPAVEEMTKEEQ